MALTLVLDVVLEVWLQQYCPTAYVVPLPVDDEVTLPLPEKVLVGGVLLWSTQYRSPC